MRERSGTGISLRSALVLYVLAPLAFALVITGYTALKIWEGQVEERMQADLEVVARAIQLPLSHAMERRRQGGMEQALESALSLDRVYRATAYDLEGRRIASAGKPDPEPESDKIAQLAFGGEHSGEYGRVGERRVYSYFVPLTDSRDQTTGLLQLTRRERDFRDYIARIRRHALGWFALGIASMTGLVLVGQHRALGRHLQRLSSDMQRVADGEAEHRMAMSGPREVAAIAVNFNGMLDNIQSTEKALSHQREEQFILEKKLRQSEHLASVGRLSAGVAHELGTPLSTIDGVAQRALRRCGEDESWPADKLNRIRHEARRMEVIVRQLLDFSRPHRLAKRVLVPARIAASVISAVADEARTRRAEIEISGDPDAPVFQADPIRMEQALVNLARNAIQAAEGGLVRISWSRASGRTVFAVDDSGPGISDEISARVFEPFYTTKPVGEGTGLGLAVVHGIAREHGGEVVMKRSSMGGARFELIVPDQDGSKEEGT